MTKLLDGDVLTAKEVRLPKGIILKPPVHFADLRECIDHDPEEAEAFVPLIRQLRMEGREPASTESDDATNQE